MTDDKRKSLRDFDYFAQTAPAGIATADGDGAAVDTPPTRYPPRFVLAIVSATAFFLAGAWLIWGYRDSIAYAFSSSRPAQELGDVTELSPADIPHNAFVALQGITEHRGLSQKTARGVVPWREEYWYFRLVGSRGVFIETPPDSERFGFATSVSVSGRAVDPARATAYALLLREYQNKYPSAATAEVRVIQVGIEPGQGRAFFATLFALFAALGAVDIASIVGFVRARRRAARSQALSAQPQREPQPAGEAERP